MRRLALVALLLGCGQDIGAPLPWTDADAVTGVLRPEEAAPPISARRAAAPDHLRVVTWNVETGKNVDGLAAALTDHPDLAAADVLLLQEEESYPSEGASRAAKLAAALNMGYVYAPERVQGLGTHGPAILSAYPLDHVQIMELPFADLPFSGHQRICLAADLHAGSAVVRVMTVHLDTRLNITDRILQMRPAIIDAPEVVVLGGDFNTNRFVWADGQVPLVTVDSVADTDQAPVFDDYMRHLGFDTPTAGLGPTQDAGGVVLLTLDHIYTRGVTDRPGAVDRDIDLSDHWPVWVDVALP